jgi:hypothetical protein
MPLTDNDDLGRRTVRNGRILAIVGVALAVLAALLLIAAVALR